jgi:hypothetical protein
MFVEVCYISVTKCISVVLTVDCIFSTTMPSPQNYLAPVFHHYRARIITKDNEQNRTVGTGKRTAQEKYDERKEETYTLDNFSYFFVSALLWEKEAT